MNLFDQLEVHPDLPLITVGQRTWSRGEFLDQCRQASRRVAAQTGIDRDQFAILLSEDPIELYAYLLALLAEGCRICLPTRESLAGPEGYFQFTAQTIRPGQAGLTVSDCGGRRPGEAAAGNLVVFSSGSTGRPKGIIHDWEDFLANAEAVVQAIGEDRPCNVTYLKPYLVSAISHFLVHARLEGHLVFQPFDALGDLPALAAAWPGLGVVGSPFQVTSAVNLLPAGHQPRWFFTSGDVVSRNAVISVLERFPSAAFHVVYGLAELAGRFFINTNHRGGANLPDALGAPIPGAVASVRDGHMMVEADYLFQGYLIDDRFVPAQHPHDSGDVVEQVDEHYFFVGRSNAEVKVLGNKVNLTHLETKAKNALGTDELAVIAIPDPRFGNLLALVLKGEPGPRAALQERLRQGLAPAEMPHKYLTVDQFPLTTSMKVDRRALAGAWDRLKVL
jgi:acyl-CoA synthetase (AMP-forming)/AMP-acid ligase II